MPRVNLPTHERYFKWILPSVAALIVLRNLLLDVMDVDAAQYAAMSLEMWTKKSFLVITDRDRPYLDKPPLLFWLSSLSMGIGGFQNIAYKLPSVSVLLLGLYSTYRLGRLYYGEDVGRLSAVVLGSSQAFFLMTNDVRTDTLLAGSLAFALWQCAEWEQGNRRWEVYIGMALGIAGAMLTKGPIGLMVPVLAVGGQLAYKRAWRRLWDDKLLVTLAVVALLLAPMVYGLYKQHGPKGITFYFWTQSFGRLTGENVWKDSSGPYFFLHTLLWTFAPWGVFAYVAWIVGLIRLVRSKLAPNALPEVMTLAGTLLPLVALSASQYKLPHYIYVFFAPLAVLVAQCLHRWATGWRWAAVLILALQQVALPVLAGLMLAYFFPTREYGLYVLPILLLGGALAAWFLVRLTWVSRAVYSSALVMLAFNFVLAFHFYPNLFQYQAGSVLGRKLAAMTGEAVYASAEYHHSVNFYAGRIIPYAREEQTLDSLLRLYPEQGLVLYVPENDVYRLDSLGYSMEMLYSADDVAISKVGLKFLNPETRYESLQAAYLYRVRFPEQMRRRISPEELYDYGMEVYDEAEREEALQRIRQQRMMGNDSDSSVSANPALPDSL